MQTSGGTGKGRGRPKKNVTEEEASAEDDAEDNAEEWTPFSVTNNNGRFIFLAMCIVFNKTQRSPVTTYICK